MDSGRPQPESRHNIPHMQLFHHLKQKFPDLKDNDVNESIQKYGLDRERCEEELSQKTQLHHGGYYGPWGRPSSTLSSPAMSRVTSPIRTTMPSPPTGVPSTPNTPVLTTTCPNSLPVHHSTATHHVFGPLHSSGYLVYSYNPSTVGVGGPEPVYTSPTTNAAVASSPVFYQPPVSSAISYGWHPSVSNGYRSSGVQSPPARQVQGSYGRQDSPYGSREASKSRSSTPIMPKSAPVVPNSYDPFSAYENKGPPERRKSEETHYNVRKNNHCNMSEMEEEDFEILNCSPYHSPTPPPNTVDSPSTLTATTTTLTTTTSSCTSPRTINGSSSGRPPPGAVIAEQRVRKERLEAEVAKQMKEKSQLEGEVEMMMRELQAREHQRKVTADTNTMRIEDVQKENQRLQSECYEMENKILRLAPDLEPEFGGTMTSPLPFPEAPHPPHLPRASSGSSLGSGTAGTPQTPSTPQQHLPGTYIPTRPAPPPPVPSPALQNHSYHDYQIQGVGGNAADEASGHKWGCSKCTFINHPDMNKCEICDYPRFTIGTAPPPPSHHQPPNHHHSSSHQGPCYCHRNHHHHNYTTPPPRPGSVVAGYSGAAASATTTTHSSYSSLPLISHDKPSLTNILKEKLVGLRDRSDSV